jgi:predicted HicB family RNase H-like nuclease
MAKKIMVLAIKNFPVDLHKRIKKQAEREHRSLKGLVIVALTEYLGRVGG